MAAQAVFHTPDLRKLIFELRLRDFHASLVKYRNLAMEELHRVEREAWRARGKAVADLHGAEKGFEDAKGTGKPHQVQVNLWQKVKSMRGQLDRKQYRVQQLAEARRALSAPAWPRHDETKLVRIRRKLNFLSPSLIRELRRGVDAVLRGTIVHVEFAEVVGRPPKRRFRNPTGTPWSQTDIRSFAAEEGGARG